jgi:O-antigen/teichoic acid export membrane protein
MFSKGQLIFAACFVIAFTLLMIWSYRKDIKIHKKYYKNTFIVLIAIFLVIAIFTLITFSLH